MAKTNTTPLSGMRDFLPRDVLRRNYVVGVIERVYQSYGFEPLETPVMERLDTLLGKYGEEGDQLIFRVLKRGAKLERALGNAPTEASVADAGMRYDLTVPLARVVAEYRNELPRYFKRYQIQPVYRADRPARGRYREFYQCDLDIVGSASRTVEAEVLSAAAEILTELGFTTADAFALRLNHRGILRGIMQVSGVPHALESSAIVAVDKLDKIGLDGVRSELEKRGIPAAAADKLLATMDAAPAGNGEMAAWLADLLEESEVGSRGVNDLKEILGYTQASAAATRLRIDPTLARGMSYYTGAIYEVEFPGLSGSGGGGGRYDDLIGMFSGQAIPSCGFSFGLERVMLIMEERELFPTQLHGEPQVLVTQFDETTVNASMALARTLRQAGLRVDLYPDPGRYGRQFQYAEDRRIPYALILGPQEIEQGEVGVKDLVTGEQVAVATGDLVQHLQEMLRE